jgi:hypothetical protein
MGGRLRGRFEDSLSLRGTSEKSELLLGKRRRLIKKIRRNGQSIDVLGGDTSGRIGSL